VIVDLEISSWRGVSIGAIHYYAVLKYEDPAKVVKNEKGYTTCSGLQSVKLERVLKASEVKTENLQLGQYGLHMRFKAGDTTEGFITEADALNAAIKYFNEHFDRSRSVLYQGDYACCSAWKNILMWPDTKECDRIALSMRKLAQEFQALNGYECRRKDYAKVERLDVRWRMRYNKMNALCEEKI
jgi:hypothetical protein